MTHFLLLYGIVGGGVLLVFPANLFCSEIIYDAYWISIVFSRGN